MDTSVSPSANSSADAFPEHHEPVGDSGSLIRTPQAKPARHLILWLMVVVALAGAGFSVYMTLQAQATMAANQAAITQWTDRLTNLEQKLTTLSTKVDTLSALPTVVPTMSLPPALFPTAFGTPMTNVSPSALTTPTNGAIPTAGSSIQPGITGDDSTSSVSGGRLTAEDEKAMLESDVDSVRKGDHKVDQPENISLVKNRQTTTDKMFNYDVFKNKDTDELYIYVRKSSTNTNTAFVDGWYGPFPAFPGA